MNRRVEIVVLAAVDDAQGRAVQQLGNGRHTLREPAVSETTTDEQDRTDPARREREHSGGQDRAPRKGKDEAAGEGQARRQAQADHRQPWPCWRCSAAVYQFVLAPKGAKAAAPPKPTPGAVVKLDPITVNLAGGHFLKLGLSLQASADAGEDVSGAKALDAAIEAVQRQDASASCRPRRRAGQGRRRCWSRPSSGLYEGKVYDIYFTDFVMQ